MRGVTVSSHILVFASEFQSTLPMRGVTVNHPVNRFYIAISIHTPHAGSDFCVYERIFYCKNFNPHSPCGEWQIMMSNFNRTHKISIHTPHAGSDLWGHFNSSSLTDFNPHSPCGEWPCHLVNPKNCRTISIHTPHAGSDNTSFPSITNPQYFNPHSPCGEWQ